MKHVAAYALLVLGGNANPSEADVTKVLKEAGATANADQVKALCAALEGKTFNEIVAAGLGSISAAGPASGGAPAAAATADAAPAKEAEPEKEASEEEDIDMMDMFGGGDDY